MNQQFVAQMWPHALRVSQRTGLDPRLVVAQSALETGWGRAAPGNNYFGIKSHGQPGGQTFATHEIVNGQRVNINDSFRAYDGMGASADGYADFLERNPRYRGLLAAEGFDDQVNALAASGYATDPNYGGKIRQIAGRIDPSQFSGQAVADDALRAVGRAPTAPQSGPQGQQALSTGGTMQARQTSPQGLPSGPEQQGGIRGLLGDRDRMDRLAVAFNSMTLNPDPSLAGFLNNRANSRDEDRQRQEASAKQAEQMQQTLGWLQANEASPEIMQAAAIGAIPLQDAVGMVLAQRRPESPTDTMRNLEWRAQQAGLEPNTPKWQQFMLTGGTEMGLDLEVSPDGGIRLRQGGPSSIGGGGAAGGDVLDMAPVGADRARVVGEDGAVRDQVIPGSKTDLEMRALTDQEQQRVQDTIRRGSTVMQDAGIGLIGLEDIEGGLSGMDNILGGFIQQGRTSLPRTTENAINRFVTSALNNVGFDQLQRMRESSPTGGALGNVTERQLDALRSVLGLWDPSLSIEDQRFILQRISNIYGEIMYGSAEERARAVQEGRMSLAEAREYDDLFYAPMRDMLGRPIPEDERRVSSVVEFLPADARKGLQDQPGQQQGQQQSPSITPEQIGSMGPRDIMAMDIENLTDAQMQAILKRMDELGL